MACALVAGLVRPQSGRPPERRGGVAVLAGRARLERTGEPAQRTLGAEESAGGRGRQRAHRHARPSGAGRAAGGVVDAAAFREYVAAEAFEEALALSRGELLAGLDEEWVYEQRDLHRQALSDLLERVAARAEADGDAAGVIAATRRRASLDPLAEDAQRALIARLARSGDRARALTAYDRLRDRFRRELGISLSDATRALIHEVRQGGELGEPPREHVSGSAEGQRTRSAGAWRPGEPFPLPPRLRRRAPTALVGRERELSRLRELWRAAREGEGARLVLVTGEAGIGKSRLARELALEVREQGAVVLHGTADEDLLVPHQHLVSAFEHFFAVTAPDELRRRIGLRAVDLEPIASGLSELTGALRETAPEGRRYRLFEGVAGVLDELSAETPVLLLIDDLHWSDQGTAALLSTRSTPAPRCACSWSPPSRPPRCRRWGRRRRLYGVSATGRTSSACRCRGYRIPRSPSSPRTSAAVSLPARSCAGFRPRRQATRSSFSSSSATSATPTARPACSHSRRRRCPSACATW